MEMTVIFWFGNTTEERSDEQVLEFKRQLEEAVRIEIGQPIEGYEPFMFIEVFPGLEPQDFNGVEALIGGYEYTDGTLMHEIGNVQVIHSAAPAVSEEGIATLLKNVLERLHIEQGEGTLIEVMVKLRRSEVVPSKKPVDVVIDEPVACTMEAKICPDGTGVGRSGPNCEFAECPTESNKNDEVVLCTNEMKNIDACIEIYQPVCGLVQVQCITSPCPPLPETFGNSCNACSAGNVISYTEGVCE